ncbi:hypothetical protein ABZ565_29340 [Streptomyces sp. NPDC016469]|uniref:hypothetical protein n=1 Tax=Streptomyces sp. NPDC016469 TaxID=3157191 RepID=UPI0033C43EF0
MVDEHSEKRPDMGRRTPHRVRLPGFIEEKEVGLGDVIKKVTSTAGIKPCSGCSRRANSLNQLMVFTGRH